MKKFLNIVYSALISLEFFAVAALTVHLDDYKAQLALLAAAFIVPFIVLIILSRKTKIFKGIRGVASILIIPLLFTFCVCISSSAIKSNSGRFESVDNGKASLFADKKVMLIVPHQDDETLLFGGVFEEYIKYGSEVDVVFATNGDAAETAETKGTRLKEAINALSTVGIDEKNIFFLGYGDTWENGEEHIYDAEPERIMTSTAGYTATYGLPDHPAFNEGAKYTRNNMISDIKNVILKIRPDTIYCVDYDKNCDHRSTSLLFEEAFGEILKEYEDYRPSVYKGFAYSTSMYSVSDYNGRNVSSTVNPYNTDYMQETNVYNWAERVRIPVSDASLSRLFRGTSVYKALECHKSQSVYRFTQWAASGDRVFWERETDSLLYDAKIYCGGSEVKTLNDFKITDTDIILEMDTPPLDGCGTEIPDGKITVTLPSAVTADRIVLYDNPSTEDNIIEAEIVFDNGETLKTGKLEKNGSGTEVSFPKRTFTSFSVEILKSEGEKAGLTEIEAFNGSSDSEVKYVKLTDEDGNFVYDYLMDSDSKSFGLYTVNTDSSDFSAKVDNSKCSVKINNGTVTVFCPKNETCKVTIENNGISDTVKISHPNSLLMVDIAVKADDFYWKTLKWRNQKYYYVAVKNYLLSLVF